MFPLCFSWVCGSHLCPSISVSVSSCMCFCPSRLLWSWSARSRCRVTCVCVWFISRVKNSTTCMPQKYIQMKEVNSDVSTVTRVGFTRGFYWSGDQSGITLRPLEDYPFCTFLFRATANQNHPPAVVFAQLTSSFYHIILKDILSSLRFN